LDDRLGLIGVELELRHFRVGGYDTLNESLAEKLNVIALVQLAEARGSGERAVARDPRCVAIGAVHLDDGPPLGDDNILGRRWLGLGGIGFGDAAVGGGRTGSDGENRRGGEAAWEHSVTSGTDRTRPPACTDSR